MMVMMIITIIIIIIIWQCYDYRYLDCYHDFVEAKDLEPVLKALSGSAIIIITIIIAIVIINLCWRQCAVMMMMMITITIIIFHYIIILGQLFQSTSRTDGLKMALNNLKTISTLWTRQMYLENKS